MCLALPGRIRSLLEEEGLRYAEVDFGGVRKRICVETLPEAREGDWVLAHAGVALQLLDARAAEEILAWAAELGAPPTPP